jgi:uncharacterized membrane protein YhaH (DUF805 family)
MDQNFDGKPRTGNAFDNYKEELKSLDYKLFFMSYEKRINRKPYIFYYFLPAIAVNIVLSIIVGIIPILIPLYFLLGIAISVAGIMPAVKRLHDLNYSGWLYLLVFVPIANLVLIILLLAGNGTAGPNRFGEDPLNRPTATVKIIQ